MPEWRVLLLGGTSAVGKSTSAWKLARQLAISCVSADSLWRAIMAVTTPETHSVLHQWPRQDVGPGEPEDLARLHIQEAELLTPALEAFIDREMQERNRLVFHGAWITPELAARKCASSEEVRAVFIDEPRAEDILASIVQRSGRTEPDQRQLVMARVEWMYGNWLREEAERHGVTTLPARPRETLVDRIIAAAG